MIHREAWYRESESPMQELVTRSERILSGHGTPEDAARLRLLRERIPNLPTQLLSRVKTAIVFQVGTMEAEAWLAAEAPKNPKQAEEFSHIQAQARYLLREVSPHVRAVAIWGMASIRQDYVRKWGPKAMVEIPRA